MGQAQKTCFAADACESRAQGGHKYALQKNSYFLILLIDLFWRRELQDRWAAARGEFGSAGMRWSAVNGSAGFLPSPHIQQATALSLICLARFR